MAYKGRVRPTIALTAADIAADAVGSSEIAAGAVGTSEIASTFDISSKTVTLPSASVTAHVTQTDTSVIENNIALLAFQIASGDSITKFGMVDQVIDGFVDSAGVDTANSINENVTAKTVSGVFNLTPWGDSSDGALSTTGNVTYTVPNKNGATDGDMVIKEYSSVTVATGNTVTVEQPCRGLVWFVDGDVSITGTVTMTGMGAGANPTTTGSWNDAGSDDNVVEATGLRFAYKTDSGSASLTNISGTGMNGVGNGARNVFRNIPDASSNGTIYQVLRAGTAGAAGVSGHSAGATGTAGSSTSTNDLKAIGFPGGGSGGQFDSGTSGSGSAGFVFGGGSGGGAMTGNRTPATGIIDATLYGIGGTGAGAGGGDSSGGGAGIPGGPGDPPALAGGDGVGGLFIIIAKGNITINSGGSVLSKGMNGGNAGGSGDCGGAGSGGGGMLLLCTGTYTNNGTVSVAGGSGGSGAGNGNAAGGAGGAGVVISDDALDTSAITGAYDDLTLISNTTTAEATATTADLVFILEDAAGTNTITSSGDVRAYVSRNGNANWSAALTLVDEGDWGTNKKIVTARNIDISGLAGTTAMRYKITTHNQTVSKQAKFHGVSLAWS